VFLWGASPSAKWPAVDKVLGWIDAKPDRLKLILLAHTAAVGALVFAATRF
jgi:hypothetical protein